MTRILSITVLIWVQQYLLKRVSVEEYSLLPLIYSLLIVVNIFSWILASGIKRYVLEAFVKNGEEGVIRIVSSMFPVLCIASLIYLAIGGAMAWKIDSILLLDPAYIDDAQVMLMLIFMLEAIRLPAQAFSNGLYVKQRFVLENFIHIASEFARLVLLFSLLFGVSVSVISVVISTIVAGFLETITLLVFSKRILPSQKIDWSKFEWGIIKDLTNYGGWSSLSGLSGMIRKSLGPLILNRLSTSVDVTTFHLGSLIPNRLEIIVNQSFLGTVSPVVVGLNAESQVERLKKLYLRVGRYLMWVVLLIIAPFLIHYEQVALLYVGESFNSAGTVMFLMLASFPFFTGNLVQAPLASAKKRMRSMAIRDAISAVLYLLLTFLLVGYYQLGAVGAATASFVVYGIGSIFIFWPFGKGMVDATWQEVWHNIVLPGTLPFFVCLVVMKVLNHIYYADSWLSIGMNAMGGSFAYLIIIWFAAKDIDRSQFRETLSRVFVREPTN